MPRYWRRDPVFITKTCLFKWTENFTTKKWKFSDKNFWFFFHISAQNIDCGYLLEPPRRVPTIYVLNRNKKNNVYPCKPQFYYIKVGYKGVNIIKACFRDALEWCRHALHRFISIIFNKVSFVINIKSAYSSVTFSISDASILTTWPSIGVWEWSYIKQEYRWNRWMLPEHAIVGTGNIILDKERYTVYTHCTSKWSITKPVGGQISLPEGTVIQTSAT